MSVTRHRTAAAEGDTAATGRRSRIWRRIGRGALVVAAGTAALSLAGPFALRPFVDAAQAAGAAGDVSVAFVLDFGGTGGQVTGCVTVPGSDNGYDALAAFVQEKGLVQPVYNSADLLCSINDVPTSGCGQVVDGGYIYWSYFTGGTGGWTYADTGAFATVTPGVVQGWRFQNPGRGNASDPAPRSAPRYNALCGPGASSNPGKSGTGGGRSEGGHRRVRPGAAAAGAVGAVPSTRTTTTSTSSSTTTTSTYPSDTTTSLPPVSIPADPETGLVAAKHSGSGGSGAGPDPLIIGGLLVAALAIAGYTRWRKRPRTP